MDRTRLHDRIRRFCRDRSGLGAADFALVAALTVGARYAALGHGAAIAALLRPILPA